MVRATSIEDTVQAPARRRVLVVDDDPTVAEVVTRYLEREGLSTIAVADGEAALRVAATERVDLVVLDLGLPGIDGLELFTRLEELATCPVVMLTARGGEEERILGLERGAADYVVKPFSPRELTARVKSVLRRSAPQATIDDDEDVRFRAAGLDIDVRARTVEREGKALVLTAKEFDLLVHFVRRPGEAIERTTLLEEVWGWTYGDASTVTVHVRRLREKIERDPSSPVHLRTVWGIGYRFEP